MNNRLINTKVAGGGGCTDIVDNYDPFGGNGVALYQLNGNANDVSGNYDGVFTNSSYTTGVFGQAANFDGTSRYVTTPYSYDWSGASWTISFWAKVDAAQDRYIMGTSQENGLAISARSSGVLFLIGGGNVPISYSLGQWKHFVYTYDGVNNVKAYGNGIQVEDRTVTVTDLSDAIVLGKYGVNSGSNTFFKGQIDQFRVFNQELNVLEVEALYTEELCICDGTVDTLDILGDGSCIATYQLDGNANDLSGNYSGTPTDVSYGVGEFDLAGVFNGSSSRVNLPSTIADTLRTAQAFTTSFWFNASVTNSGALLSFFNDIYIYVFLRSDNKIEARVTPDNFPTNPQIIILSTNTIAADTWYNVCFTGNSTNGVTFYLNNVSQGNASWNGTFEYYSFTANKYNSFGAINPTTNIFNGSIDQVRIFNKALNSTEVTTLYNETACTKVTREAGATQILGDSSCVAYYKLDGTAADETGTYNGTFTNPNYGNGEFDFAALFNGSNNYINLPDNSFKLSTITVSAWFNSASTQANQTIYSCYDYQSSQSRGFNIRVTDSNLILFQPYKSDANTNVFSTSQIQRNIWNHVVVVATQSSASIYINGSLDNSGSITGFDYFTTHPFAIGRAASEAELYFDGSIDQVRIFNKAISASEVTTLYNEGI